MTPANRIDIGAFDFWLWKGTLLRMDTNRPSVVADVYETIDLSKAGISNALDEFLLQISFEYMDYNGDGAYDGMKVNVFANGKPVFAKDIMNCKISQIENRMDIQQGATGSITVNSVVGDAHADGAIDTRDLVAVLKAENGMDLGTSYENMMADVCKDDMIDEKDVDAFYSKLLD